jgi:hypothetical protein
MSTVRRVLRGEQREENIHRERRMKTLGQILSEGFRVLEEHNRETIKGGVLGGYIIVETPDKKRYLTKKDSDSYVEIVNYEEK